MRFLSSRTLLFAIRFSGLEPCLGPSLSSPSFATWSCRTGVREEEWLWWDGTLRQDPIGAFVHGATSLQAERPWWALQSLLSP